LGKTALILIKKVNAGPLNNSNNRWSGTG